MPFNRLNHTVLGEIRPRFFLKTTTSVEECLDHVVKSLKTEVNVSGMRSGELIFLKTPKHKQHYWSPEMTVRIETNEYIDYTRVCCLIGPRQTVWVMFAFIYAAIAVATLFASMFGFVQYAQSGYSPWLWVIPIGFVLVSSAFIVAKMGQKKGRDQMLYLVSFIYHALDEIGPVERAENR
ncbi:MAG: hypothetical protein WC044_07330 [Crocinitomicaceae bacterium]